MHNSATNSKKGAGMTYSTARKAKTSNKKKKNKQRERTLVDLHYCFLFSFISLYRTTVRMLMMKEYTRVS